MKFQHLYTKEGKINPQVYSRKFIVWGNGGDSDKFLTMLPKEGMENLICFADSSSDIIGTKRLDKDVIDKDFISGYKDVNIVLAFRNWNQVSDFELLNKISPQHIFADAVIPASSTEHCILCGGRICMSGAHFTPFIAAREFNGNPPATKLLMCQKCGFTYSSYRPTDDEMGNLYAGYRNDDYYNLRHKFEPQYTKEFNDIFLQEEYINKRRNRLWEFLSEFSAGIKSVLDYGGDRGQMIPREFEGIRRVVFDISNQETEPGIEHIRSLNEVLCGEFDLVLCEHLLEHVSSPAEIIGNLIKAATKNGYVYVEVPYETIWKNYSDYPFSEHINFFTAETMKVIGKRFGLKIMKSKVLENSIILVLYKKE